MIKWLKCLFTGGHDLKFVRNIYGDEIIISGYQRSRWQCSKCRSVVLKRPLYYGDGITPDGNQASS